MISGGRPGLLTGPARPRPARPRSTAGVLARSSACPWCRLAFLAVLEPHAAS